MAQAIDSGTSGDRSALGRILLFSWVVGGILAVPMGPKMWAWLALGLGPSSALIAPTILVVAGVGGWLAIIRSGRDVAWRSVGFLAPVAIAMALVLARSDFPAERFHVVQFAVLAALAGMVWGRSLGPVAPVLIAGLLGAMDEGCQALIPTREFSWIDMGANLVGACLGGGAWTALAGLRRPNDHPLTRFVTGCAWMLAVVLAWGVIVLKPWEKARPPIVLLTVDSLRADALRPGLMPFVSSLADAGLRFDSAYSVAPWTSPNLVSLHTGLLPAAHGVRSREASFDPHLPTMARVLRRAGYRAPDLLSMGADPGFRELGLEVVEIGGGSVIGAVAAWVSRFGDRDEPVFLWLHLVGTHLPYERHPHVDPTDAVEVVTREMLIPDGSLILDESGAAAVRLCYEAGARSVDEVIAGVADVLGASGLWEESLVIVTADHGEELGERGNIGHASTTGQATLFEEVLRIPLVIRWPRVLPAGVRIEAPVQLTDVFPTVCDWLGLAIPGKIDGRVLPLENGDASRLLLFESNQAGYQGSPGAVDRWKTAGIRGGRKVIFDAVSQTGRGFDLHEDPGEVQPFPVAGEGAPNWASALAEDMRRAMSRLDEGRLVLTPAGRAGPPGGMAEQEGCPQIQFPGEGATLAWPDTDRFVLGWSGSKDGRYMLDYDVGSGDYRLSGTLEFSGNRQEFGPFTVETWERFATYTPWRFRVWPAGDPACASSWRTFSVEYAPR